MSLAFSHTHSGPLADARYFELLAARAAEATRQARASLLPACCGWGLAETNANMNRRVLDRSGRAAMDVAVVGARDRSVAVLRVDHLDGSPLAALVRFAAHGTVLRADNLAFSADWPGALRRAVSSRRSVARCSSATPRRET